MVLLWRIGSLISVGLDEMQKKYNNKISRCLSDNKAQHKQYYANNFSEK